MKSASGLNNLDLYKRYVDQFPLLVEQPLSTNDPSPFREISYMMNPKIGTTYTSVYDVNLGEYFSRCFDCLNCFSIHSQCN